MKIQLAVLKTELKTERELREKEEKKRLEVEKQFKASEKLRIEAEKQLAVKSRELVLKTQMEDRRVNIMLNIYCNHMRPMAWKESDPGWEEDLAYLKRRMTDGIPIPRTVFNIVQKVDSNFEKICYDEASDQLLFVVTDKNRGHAKYINNEGKQCDDAGCVEISKTLAGVRYIAIRDEAEKMPKYSFDDRRYIIGKLGSLEDAMIRRMVRRVKSNSYNFLNQLRDTKMLKDAE